MVRRPLGRAASSRHHEMTKRLGRDSLANVAALRSFEAKIGRLLQGQFLDCHPKGCPASFGYMSEHTNEFGLPIGAPVQNWTPRPRPPRTVMTGQYCRVEPLNPDLHAADLFAANNAGADARNWTYLAYGPFDHLTDYRDWIIGTCMGDDPLFHAVIDGPSDKAVGIASYLRIEPAVGVIETGHINYSPLMQGTRSATEAMYLMMARVFDELGYRRYEWKCDSLNGPSRAAAERLGFQFEGIFRQATMYRGRNRDTAWFSVLDTEWPAVKAAFQTWLDPANFDADGKQRKRLVDLRKDAG